MKIKTSISIEESILKKAKEVADGEERSTSYVLEKIITSVLSTADDSKSFSEALKQVAGEIKARGQAKIKAARDK